MRRPASTALDLTAPRPASRWALHWGLLWALLGTSALSAAPLDDLLRCHVEARGGLQRIRAIETLVYSEGLYEEGDYKGSGNAFMAFARPYLRAVGDPDGGGSFREGYDGSAWEWYADPGVVVRTVGHAAGAIRRGADFEGVLIEPQEKGVTVRLGEEIAIDGRPAIHLTVIYPDDFSTELYLDRESCLIVAQRKTAPIHAFGEAVTSETRIGDYRPVAGVLFAHRFVDTEIATGRPLSSMQWRRIEANRNLPASWFAPPDFERAPIQKLTEHLYFQRNDPVAVAWTYREFRRFHPEIETASAVEFAGYQMLKMGNVVSALELLERNADDHPQRADAAFGLGRAYETAGDVGQAQSAYRRALDLDPEHRRARRALDALAEAGEPVR
jgi:hypothetical protein